MKKIFISLFACAAVLTSCDLNTEAPGMLDDETAISDIDRAQQQRNYIYSQLRSCTVGGWIYSPDLQMDQFIGLSTNGNRGGELPSGNISSSTSIFSSTYNGMYNRIANANYLIEKAALLINENSTEEDILELNRYIGEAKFARAYYYFWLMDHFCPVYNESIGDTPALGLSIVTKYDPTYVDSKYPGRSTLNEVLALIKSDLTDAYTALKAYEDAGNTGNLTAGANFLSSYTVTALEARIALHTGDYNTALTKAQAVIDSGYYTLASGNDFLAVWTDENVSELIFAPYVDAAESSAISSTCEGYNYWWSDTNQTDFLPTEETIYTYFDADGNIRDYRFLAYFKVNYVNIQGGAIQAYVFNKYPGNESLIAGTANNYLNTPKPFRIAEQYLIVAEAAAALHKDDVACDALNTLLKARRTASGYSEIALAGNELQAFVREERARELLGEGFRFNDCRRWGIAWQRYAEYSLNPDVAASFNIADKNCKYTADDYRYIWPIPADEMEINPQLAGQQNPGY